MAPCGNGKIGFQTLESTHHALEITYSTHYSTTRTLVMNAFSHSGGSTALGLIIEKRKYLDRSIGKRKEGPTSDETRHQTMARGRLCRSCTSDDASFFLENYWRSGSCTKVVYISTTNFHSSFVPCLAGWERLGGFLVKRDNRRVS